MNQVSLLTIAASQILIFIFQPAWEEAEYRWLRSIRQGTLPKDNSSQTFFLCVCKAGELLHHRMKRVYMFSKEMLSAPVRKSNFPCYHFRVYWPYDWMFWDSPMVLWIGKCFKSNIIYKVHILNKVTPASSILALRLPLQKITLQEGSSEALVILEV